MMDSVLVHACNDEHVTVYEGLRDSNNIGNLVGTERTWEWDREIPVPVELYHRMTIILLKEVNINFLKSVSGQKKKKNLLIEKRIMPDSTAESINLFKRN